MTANALSTSAISSDSAQDLPDNVKSRSARRGFSRRRRPRGERRAKARALVHRMHEKRRTRARSGLSRRKKATIMLSAGTAAMGTAAASQVSALAPIEPTQDIVILIEQRSPAALMQSSDTLKQALMHEEGVRHTVYLDFEGNPTVGVGHLITAEDNLALGDRIGQDRMLELLESDLAHAEAAVARLVGDLPLHQYEYDALVDLVFNVGEANVGLENSPRLNAAIAAGDYNAIADELATYVHTDAGKAPGLVERSERRVTMFMSGNYETRQDSRIARL